MYYSIEGKIFQTKGSVFLYQLYQVSAGPGGDCYLIVGAEKAGIYDTGMAYCAPGLIANIEKILGQRSLDYIFASHSHYDHIGAAPYIKRRWPQAQLLAHIHAKEVLQKPGALRTIRRLNGEAATFFHGPAPLPYDESLFQVDQVIGQGDIISLGGAQMKVYETPGHTRCSLTFVLESTTSESQPGQLCPTTCPGSWSGPFTPEDGNGYASVLFASETCGYTDTHGRLIPSYLVSFEDTLHSIDLCESLKCPVIISPHYGFVMGEGAKTYWQRCYEAALASKNFLLQLYDQGLSEAEILRRYEAFIDGLKISGQPKSAYILNTRSTLQLLVRTFRPNVSRSVC